MPLQPLTVIIPTLREPEYLDICLDSLYKTQNINHQVIVVVDGFPELNQPILEKYKDKPDFIAYASKQNQGLAYSLNVGVNFAKYEKVLIINDDNVFPRDWDINIFNHFDNIKSEQPYFLVPNQIEPIFFGNLFSHLFILKDLGIYHHNFDLDKFLDYEEGIKELGEYTNFGWTFPFVINKIDYQKVGGWDLMYNSPHCVDLDFFYKLELLRFKSYRIHDVNFYHFSGKATINVDEDSTRQIHDQFRQKEGQAMGFFKHKWGFIPYRKPDNSI